MNKSPQYNTSRASLKLRKLFTKTWKVAGTASISGNK